MPEIWIGSRVSTDSLIEDLYGDLSQEQAIEFILALDLRFADLSFTTELYARLGDALREELESDE